MKGFERLFLVLAIFFVIAAGVYTVWTAAYDSQPLATDPSAGGERRTVIEWVGTVALALCGVLSLLLAFHLRRVHGSQNGELPEDRDEGEVDDGDPELGHFSPHSWWPITLALSASLVFAGIAVGIWIAIIGVALFAIAIVGWVYEYYRGYFAR